MTNVDEFESIFRSASREVFRCERVNIGSVLVVTDRDEEKATFFGDRIRRFLKVLSADEKVRWRDVNGSDFQTAGEEIRTLDVQLGKSKFRLQATVGKALMCGFLGVNEDCKRLTS